ncbi:phospholipid-transporting ATPase ABCA1 isoform X2 [Tribolium castaneum]|uniref:phospholipid-transporting ATPase ABCA1 isoform X2 n=1 Tax=Tribolium castaneum TaxID=7070 RepID=UPI0030FF0435
MPRHLSKIILLLHKNFIIWKRHWLRAFCEFIFPIALCWLLVCLRHLTLSLGYEQTLNFYMSFFPNEETLCESDNETHIPIAYSPTSTLLENILKRLCIRDRKPLNIENYDTSEELSDAVTKKNFSFAIQLEDSLKGLSLPSQLPDNIKIYIRLPSQIYKTGQKIDWYTKSLFPKLVLEKGAEYTDYEGRGFLHLQKFLALSLLSTIKDKEVLPVRMQPFPYPQMIEDWLNTTPAQTISIFLLIMAFITNINNIITDVAVEKETQVKEYMKVMGLSGWLLWLTWFLRSFIILLFTVAIMTVVLKLTILRPPVFIHTDGTVLFALFLVYACSLITFMFLISTIFQKATIAIVVGIILYMVALIVGVTQFIIRASLYLKIVTSVLSPSAMFFGLSMLFELEAKEKGGHWNNLFESSWLDNKASLGVIFVILILDTVLYMVIALYLEAVIPGEFGVPRPWYFPFTRTFWCKSLPEKTTEESSQKDTEQFEKFTDNLPVGIKLYKLSKSFGSSNAVKDLNLDMYEGHITVLLGHNGAGKSTTMSMICGMCLPTSGTAIVNGYDVRTNIHNVRESMGLCPQHNLLFDDLTVYEHLYFFGKLKDLENDEIKKEIDYYLTILELENKRKQLSKTLSGGMKRKLSVAIALCGKSKVIMLDEPTAGMDPSARRTVWDLLQQQKNGRTILLTTHYMDEADLLGDRIAIMTAGELQCCGSSFFLRKKYGSDYYLILEVTPKCRPFEVTDLLAKYVPNIQIHSHVGSELTYILPDKASEKFEILLEDLEYNKATLGIQNLGISLATLEEVFLKVAAAHDMEISEKFNKKTTDSEMPKKEKISYQRGFKLMRNQMVAMMLKKNLSLLRSWLLLVFQIILPSVLLYLALAKRPLLVRKEFRTFSSLKLSLSSYNNPITLLENGSSMANTYVKVLKGFNVKTVQNVTAEILNMTYKSLSTVEKHYIVGASFYEDIITAWFNIHLYHAAPLSLSLVLNTLYEEVLHKNKSITFFNYPLPRRTSSQQLKNYGESNDLSRLEYGLKSSIGIATGTYILFYIRERMSKCKHLQIISGVNAFIFWSIAFLCDLITYLITVISLLIVMTTFEGGFETFELGLLILLFVCFCFFVLPLTYLMSYCFKIPSTGCGVMVVFGVCMVFIPTMVYSVLEESDASHSTRIFFEWVFIFTPYYSVVNGITAIITMRNIRKECDMNTKLPREVLCEVVKECCYEDFYYSFEEPGIGRNIFIPLFMSFLLFTIIFLTEFNFFSRICTKVKHFHKPPNENVILESDVHNENETIRNTSVDVLRKSYLVVLRDVSKYYGKCLAVNSICLGVNPSECFGLLGVNGAGKTTTFKMMTGDESITFGDAWIHGMSVTTQQKQVQTFIGYCPQFDALLEDLTVKETLLIFALIRGVSFDKCIALVESLAQTFDFFEHINKKIKHLSGGNKRKVSTALAIIGDPPIIFLDEPSAGMDPVTKRFLWNNLIRLRDAGKCIVLTSHSMEECEALCTRIAIMVNGTFQCLGSTQRLKSKFAQGYTLKIKIKKLDDQTLTDNRVSAVKKFVQKHFPGSELKERYQELVTYHLVNPKSLSLSQMFGMIEASRQQLKIQDYSLGQCSLEEVFLKFAKNQREYSS